MLLVAGVVAATLVVPEIVADVSGGAVEGAMILLVGGAALVAASAIGLRLRRATPPGEPEPASPAPGPAEVTPASAHAPAEVAAEPSPASEG